MVFTTIDDFYIADGELHNSPSRQDGVDEATETLLRRYGCQLIQEAGILLKYTQIVMATAQVVLHRFYCRQSLMTYPVKVCHCAPTCHAQHPSPQSVAAASLYLASKLEEEIRMCRELLSVFYRLERRAQGLPLDPLDIYSQVRRHGRNGPDTTYLVYRGADNCSNRCSAAPRMLPPHAPSSPHPQKYEGLKRDLFRTERIIMKTFGFIVHIDHPHKLVLNYLQLIFRNRAPKALVQQVWGMTNDSLRTTLCVRLRAEAVACGVIFFAARRSKVLDAGVEMNHTMHAAHGVCTHNVDARCTHHHPSALRPSAPACTGAAPRGTPLVGPVFSHAGGAPHSGRRAAAAL